MDSLCAGTEPRTLASPLRFAAVADGMSVITVMPCIANMACRRGFGLSRVRRQRRTGLIQAGLSQQALAFVVDQDQRRWRPVAP